MASFPEGKTQEMAIMLGFLFHILWRKVRDAFCGYGMASRWQRYPLYEHIPLLC